jgi:putative lipoic acid-binding regulatory protein
MSLDIKYSSLKKKLEESGEWPAEYVFKFILKSAEKEKQIQVRQLFNQNVSLSFKSSSKGKYISVTIKAVMADPDSIINTYKEAGKIKDLIVF